MAENLKCNVLGPFFGLRCTQDAGHAGDHWHTLHKSGVGGMSATWEPEPKMPKEYFLHFMDAGHPNHFHEPGAEVAHCVYWDRMLRVHDANECDRTKLSQWATGEIARHEQARSLRFPREFCQIEFASGFRCNLPFDHHGDHQLVGPA